MQIRKLRQEMDLSPEQLAESARLSLRTIQRVEAGHRVSYASLRAIASIFDVDVDLLERELYAMNSSENEYVEKPLWIRLILGLPLLSRLSRSGLIRHELSLVAYAFFAYASCFIIPKVDFSFGNLTTVDAMYFSAFSALFVAYIVSITLRLRGSMNMDSRQSS